VDGAGNIKTEVRTVRYIPHEIQETPAVAGFSFYLCLVSFVTIVIFRKKIKKPKKLLL